MLYVNCRIVLRHGKTVSFFVGKTMYRGTTPSITFNIKTDIDLDELAVCYITLKSVDKNIVETYDLDDIIVDSQLKTLTIALSQEETLAFARGVIYVQIRLRTNDDLAYASQIKELRMNDILKDGVI